MMKMMIMLMIIIVIKYSNDNKLEKELRDQNGHSNYCQETTKQNNQSIKKTSTAPIN